MKLKRTKNLFRTGNLDVNEKFVKNGYIYLLRGDKKGLERGLTSFYYRQGHTLENMKIDANKMARAHVINGKTAFISATTNYKIAASFANRQKIYVVRVPLEDIFIYCDDLTRLLFEYEYLIPDIIEASEIIKTFKYDRLTPLYKYLVEELDLPISPTDLGVDDEWLKKIDYNELEMMEEFNNAGSSLDPMLEAIQKILIK